MGVLTRFRAFARLHQQANMPADQGNIPQLWKELGYNENGTMNLEDWVGVERH